MNIGVVRFPGTNNEHETIRALQSFGVEASIIDHKQVEKIKDFDGYWLAGGFSYADVLRAGAIASKSEIIKEIARTEKPTIGICNGFQILTEANLLPGALLPNTSTRFICKWVNLRVMENDLFSNFEGEVWKIPIAHFEGNLFTGQSNELQPFVKYSTSTGDITDEANPNGSDQNIAGLISDRAGFIGMMPHPERASFKYQGSIDGRKVIQTFLDEVKR